MIEHSKSNLQPFVAVATLDGKAYYSIIHLLRRVGIPFVNLTIGEKVGAGIKLVVTTRKEKHDVDFRKILCIEELGGDLDLAKERIIGEIYSNQKDILLIGVDPGLRIGLVAYYQHRELDEEVVNSIQEAVSKITRLVDHSHARKRVVRIGYGKPELAEALAKNISTQLRGSVEIELVDERGTSSVSRMKPNRRGLRDLHSAQMIALRQGTKFVDN